MYRLEVGTTCLITASLHVKLTLGVKLATFLVAMAVLSKYQQMPLS
jgi:hypothetical protein